MISMAQRIQELRTERGLSRPQLSAALGLPKNAAEKFETGRQTPTQEQQAKLAEFFGVSLFYLRGESRDRTRQETWMEEDFVDDAPAPQPRQEAPRPKAKAPAGEGSLVEPFLKSRAFQEALRQAALEALRSPEGQALLAQAIRRELGRGK